MAILGPRSNGKSNRDLRQVSLLAAVPALLVAGPLVGYFGGRWLDSKFETDPTWMIVGIILGFAAAGLEIAQLVKKSSAIEKENDDKQPRL